VIGKGILDGQSFETPENFGIWHGQAGLCWRSSISLISWIATWSSAFLKSQDVAEKIQLFVVPFVQFHSDTTPLFVGSQGTSPRGRFRKSDGGT
jgi:hypothetical protein